MSKKHYPEHIRSFREEEHERGARCLESGKTYVHAYQKDDGTWVRGHCRETTAEEKESAKRILNSFNEISERKAESFGNDYQFVQTDYDLENILESIGVPEEERRDFTGAFIKTRDGSYDEVWATRGGKPYDTKAYYEKVK